MANTYITSGSRFTPFTFDKMIRPANMYKQAYDAVEEGLTNLEVLSGDIESKLTSSDEDNNLRELYKNFNNELYNVTNLLSSGNLQEAKKQANKLLGVYAKNINPINEAYKRRLEFEKSILNTKAQNPHLIVADNTYSTADFMGGNTPDLPQMINKTDVINSAIKQATSTSGRIVDYSIWSPELGGKLITQKEYIGVSEKNLIKGYSDFRNKKNTPEAILFSNMFNQELQKYSNLDSFSPKQQEDVINSIVEGIFKGTTYKESSKSIQNPNYTPYDDGSGEDPIYDIKGLYPISTRSIIRPKTPNLLGIQVLEDLLHNKNNSNNKVPLRAYKKIDGYYDNYSVWQRGVEFLSEGLNSEGRDWVPGYFKLDSIIEDLVKEGVVTRIGDNPVNENNISEYLDKKYYNESELPTIGIDYTKINENFINRYKTKHAGGDAYSVPEMTIQLNQNNYDTMINDFILEGYTELYKADYDVYKEEYIPSEKEKIQLDSVKAEDINGVIVGGDGSLVLNINGTDYMFPITNNFLKNNIKNLKDSQNEVLLWEDQNIERLLKKPEDLTIEDKTKIEHYLRLRGQVSKHKQGIYDEFLRAYPYYNVGPVNVTF